MKKLSALTLLLLAFLFALSSCNKEENTPTPTPTPTPQGPFITFTTANGLLSNAVSAIAICKDGKIWVGTDKGLSLYDGKKWLNYTSKDGLVYDEITSLKLDKNENLLIGTTQGFSIFNSTFKNFKELNGAPFPSIYSISVDKNDNIWIGTSSNMIIRYDHNTFTSYQVAQEKSGHIHAITCDASNNIWVGSCKTGLSMFNGTSWLDKVNSREVFTRSLFCCSNGDLLVADYSGVYKFTNNTWIKLLDEDTYSIKQDHQGNIWRIATSDNKIRVYKNNKWYNVSDISVSILEVDLSGNVWVGAKGLTKIPKEYIDEKTK